MFSSGRNSLINNSLIFMQIKHIAIIPDGNRRWARREGISPTEGHKTGLETVERIFEKAIELKIPHLTFWAASYDNLIKRPREEVNFLIRLLTKEFKKLLDDVKVHKNKVKIRVLGRFREILPPKTLEIIESLINKTENYNIFSLTFLLAYNGTDEMTSAVREIIKEAKKRVIIATDGLIKNFLWTKDLPMVDLVVRTGCEDDPHNSAGFMMWHTVYSQYYFTKTLFPAFSTGEFEKAIIDFSKREKRMGR